jgi:SIR2-like domain
MSTQPEAPAETLCRLARKVVNGDVVFFIGSGFSIDSEGNSGVRLISRLLIRLLALTETLADVSEAKNVFDDLGRTFGLPPAAAHEWPFRISEAAVKTLADRYYETNDWFCGAYGHLLALIAEQDEWRWETLLDDIAARENGIRLRGRGESAIDAVALERIDVALVPLAARDARLAGKALFLDTMGFRNPGVMGGTPMLPDPLAVSESYGTKLRPRHHIVARLAREGFCSTTITANFDLLLEGAFRVAGFTTESSESFSPPAHLDGFARIASPTEFFRRGKAHRDAILVKMHGCADRYRRIACSNGDELRDYLPSMVFTYREIQNWRQDSWAADYLRTLLRTRTVVFCGYSLQDPVIHDTFRTVYEDMERRRSPSPSASLPPTARDAPAFFLAPASEDDRREFHGMEVLQAATRAVGAKPAQFRDHPNYVRFRYGNRPEFPRLDELLQWLSHAVFRLRQEECLKGALHRTVIGLFGAPKPDAELDSVRRAFDAQWQREQQLAARWNESPASRREHAAICNWTSQFHLGLMRELASVEMLHQRRGPGHELALMRRLPWYYPTTAAAGWTAWGAVLELALRKMLAAAWGRDDEAALPPHAIRAAESLAPTLLYSPTDASRTPVALTIRFAGLERHGVQPRIVGSPVRHVTWELGKSDAPWPRRTAPVRVDRDLEREIRVPPPPAGAIWEWAAGVRRTMTADLRRSLGIE